jgi:hypothetical protein
MQPKHKIEEIAERINHKGNLKQDIYDNTFAVMKMLKIEAQKIIEKLRVVSENSKHSIPLEYKDKSDFEFEIKFAGDILIFMMHTNIFEFSRYHEIMKTPYISKDSERSYCGIINIYNFLADSFKYNRISDYGYMIGRLFINKESHYYIEGKREIAMIYNDFAKSAISIASVEQILLSAIMYTVNFDLLTPPYDEVKIVSVSEMQETIENMRIKTAKRLGFKFQADLG